LLAANPFRRDLQPAIANQSIWPWLIMVGSCLFFADVFVRRVQVNFGWLTRLLASGRDWMLRREPDVAVPETMGRLRSRKREISDQIEDRRAATRFQESVDATEETSTVATASTAAAPPQVTGPNSSHEGLDQASDAGAEPSYTERLLKAKRQVWHDREQGPDDEK
jgi:hypothetical protein